MSSMEVGRRVRGCTVGCVQVVGCGRMLIGSCDVTAGLILFFFGGVAEVKWEELRFCDGDEIFSGDDSVVGGVVVTWGWPGGIIKKTLETLENPLKTA